MKTVIIFLLFLLSIMICSGTPFSFLESINGYWWIKTANEYPELCLIFLQGYLVGHWTCAGFCYEKEIITDTEMLYAFEYNLLNVPLSVIAAEISAFYVETERLEYPLYIVVHIRNERGNLPKWSDISSDVWP